MNRLLLVEDDDSHAEIFSFHAANHTPGLQIQRLGDGEAAMNFLRTASQKEPDLPDLIVLDLNLPKYNGLEVLEAIKEHPVLRSIPTVVFTSSNSETDVSHAFSSGANSYLRKPLQAGEFKPLIHLALEYWGMNETIRKS